MDDDYIERTYGPAAAQAVRDSFGVPVPDGWVLYEGDVSELAASDGPPDLRAVFIPDRPGEALVFLPTAEG